jgi:hypothetical protein
MSQRLEDMDDRGSCMRIGVALSLVMPDARKAGLSRKGMHDYVRTLLRIHGLEQKEIAVAVEYLDRRDRW